MMKVRRAHALTALTLAALSCAVLASNTSLALASPPSVSSGELVENAARWDGERIVFEGEAIGDAMVRGADAWLHVNDDAYAELPIPAGGAPRGYNSGHAILAPASEAEKVTAFGSYRTRGDIVRVTGVFRAADPRHGGDMLIEAESVELLESGFAIRREIPRWKLLLLGGLLPVAALAYVLYRHRASALPR